MKKVKKQRAPAKSGSNPLKRAVGVVDVIASSAAGLHLNAIAHQMKLPPSTTHRQLQSLVAIGYLELDPGTKIYGLGARLRRVLYLTLGAASLKQVARPVLIELADQFVETTYLVHYGAGVTGLVDYVMPVRGSRTLVHPGHDFPIHATAAGKALYAFQSDADVNAALHSGLEPFQKNTITDPAEVRRELKRVRGRGYAVNNVELDPGVFAIAVPISIGNLGVTAALGVVGLRERMADRSEVEHYVELLKAAAEEISRLMPATTRSASE